MSVDLEVLKTRIEEIKVYSKSLERSFLEKKEELEAKGFSLEDEEKIEKEIKALELKIEEKELFINEKAQELEKLIIETEDFLEER